jgi:hypothetical protein
MGASMETADNIVERLPGFYRAREKNSYLYSFADGIAKIIDQQKSGLLHIRDSHWMESAHGIDLDLLASIFGIARKRKETDEEYRSRLRTTFSDFKKGGTVEAVRAQLASFLAISKEEIVVIENPPTELQELKKVISGETWVISSTSIRDEKATMVLSLEDGEASDPTVIDSSTNTAIRYKGTLRKGDNLEIHEGKAKLNGVDATKSISFESSSDSPSSSAPLAASDLPKIPRKPSKWIFKERLTDTLGRFDQSKFDENVFFKPVPPTTLKLRWTARLLASFEIKIPTRALDKSNLTKQEVETLVNAIKAAGIRTFVTIMPETGQLVSTKEEMTGVVAPAQLAGKVAGP